jgi:signal transduction histidine kinase
MPVARRSSHTQWWLGGMLLALHFAVAWGIDDWWSRGLLLVHFGLFLIWQPLWRGEGKLESRQAFLVLMLGVLLAAWNSWWLMAIWLAALFALIGGNLLGSEQPRQRLAATIAALYLLSMLLIWVVPHTFVNPQFDLVLIPLVRYGLPVLPILIMLIPIPAGSKSSPLAVDLFYSLMLFLLVTVLVLGSFAVKQVSHGDYLLALAQSLLVMALILITLSWLWNPRSGFTGIGYQLSRYLMSLGLPFERWVKSLADLAEHERDPAKFLSRALRDMCELPWLSGVAWQAQNGSGEHGTASQFQAEYSIQDLNLKFYARWSLSPALLLNLKLLTQMLGHFYEAKKREQTLRQNAYTQAIYETGARLTHDVKNLLQSMRSLVAATENSSADQSMELQALIKRQLPQITQRLTVTLEKLKSPQQPQAQNEPKIDAIAWWQGLQQRYPRGEIEFRTEGLLSGTLLPGELFDSIAENLLQNAIAKAQQDGDIKIVTTLSSVAGITLTVCDSGQAIPPNVITSLFDAPVSSRSGLGIGLYQAAKQAELLGYKLQVANNRDGNVCFELRKVNA